MASTYRHPAHHLRHLGIGTDGPDATTAANCAIVGDTLHCEHGDLAAGASVVVHVTSTTTSADCPGVDNESASTSSTNDGSDTVEDVAIVINCADLGITKTADADPINAGDTAGFVITVTNTGDGLAHGVDIDDALPAPSGTWVIDTDGPDATTAADCAIVGDTLHCDQDDLAAGASVTVHVTSTTSSADCPTRTLNNTAFTTSTNDGSAQASDSITINCPVLQITKIADADPINAGDTAGFVVTVTNTGAGLAHGVDIDDALPATSGTWVIDTDGPDATTAAGCAIVGDTLHCDQDDLAAGASVSVHVTSRTKRRTAER